MRRSFGLLKKPMKEINEFLPHGTFSKGFDENFKASESPKDSTNTTFDELDRLKHFKNPELKSKIHDYYDSGFTPRVATDLHQKLMTDDDAWYQFINEKPPKNSKKLKKSNKKHEMLSQNNSEVDFETEDSHTVYTNRRPVYFDTGEGHNQGRKGHDGRILNVYEYDDDFTVEDHDSFKYSATLTNLWMSHIKCGYSDDRAAQMSQSEYKGSLSDVYESRPRQSVFKFKNLSIDPLIFKK